MSTPQDLREQDWGLGRSRCVDGLLIPTVYELCVAAADGRMPPGHCIEVSHWGLPDTPGGPDGQQ